MNLLSLVKGGVAAAIPGGVDDYLLNKIKVGGKAGMPGQQFAESEVRMALQSGPPAGVAEFKRLWNAMPGNSFENASMYDIANGINGGDDGVHSTAKGQAFARFAIPFVSQYGRAAMNTTYGSPDEPFNTVADRYTAAPFMSTTQGGFASPAVIIAIVVAVLAVVFLLAKKG